MHQHLQQKLHKKLNLTTENAAVHNANKNLGTGIVSNRYLLLLLYYLVISTGGLTGNVGKMAMSEQDK